MHVHIEVFAQLGQLAGASRFERVIPDGTTAQDFIRDFAIEQGETFRELVVDASGTLQPTVLVFVGEEQVDWPVAYPLTDGDRLLLATPIAGG